MYITTFADSYVQINYSLSLSLSLMIWYTQQEMKVKWGNSLSSSFHVGIGVEQGGILLSVLFIIYMNKHSMTLHDTAIGGHIGDQLLNHFCYADDMCLICIFSADMQELLNVCHSFSVEHSLLHNGNKSYSLCFNPIFLILRDIVLLR